MPERISNCSLLSGTAGIAANGGDWTLAKTKSHHRDERVTLKRIHSKNAMASVAKVEKVAKDNDEPKLILS